MTEGQPHFSPEEEKEIAEVSSEAAKLGEDYIHDLTLAKVGIMKLQILSYANGIEIFDGDLSKIDFEHEDLILGEIVRRASASIQFQGKDIISLLDKRYREAGLGSLFDPESAAHKRFGHLLD